MKKQVEEEIETKVENELEMVAATSTLS